MHLARTDLFRARWTDRIHDEWISNLLKNRPDLQPAKLRRTRKLMNDAVLDCLITGYEPLIGSFGLPDPGDEHVLAAAVAGEADIIVTSNFKHFPARITSPLDIEIQYPDDFFVNQFTNAPELVLAAVKQQRTNMVKPPVSAKELLSVFEKIGLEKSALLLTARCKEI
jgi:hypothetical protein